MPHQNQIQYIYLISLHQWKYGLHSNYSLFPKIPHSEWNDNPWLWIETNSYLKKYQHLCFDCLWVMSQSNRPLHVYQQRNTHTAIFVTKQRWWKTNTAYLATAPAAWWQMQLMGWSPHPSLNRMLEHHRIPGKQGPFQCTDTGISLGIHPANERCRYNVTTPLIGWAHT